MLVGTPGEGSTKIRVMLRMASSSCWVCRKVPYVLDVLLQFGVFMDSCSGHGPTTSSILPGLPCVACYIPHAAAFHWIATTIWKGVNAFLGFRGVKGPELEAATSFIDCSEKVSLALVCSRDMSEHFGNIYSWSTAVRVCVRSYLERHISIMHQGIHGVI